MPARVTPASGNFNLGTCHVANVPMKCQAAAAPGEELSVVRIFSLKILNQIKNWIRRENSA